MPARLSPEQLQRLGAQIVQWAQALGFADAAVSRVQLAEDRAHLRRWLDQDRHGQMQYMARNLDLRDDPGKLVPDTLSVISARMPYWPDAEPASAVLKDRDAAYISRYALGRDYHKVLRTRLRHLARRIESEVGAFGYRAFADSAPLLEKALARDASLGWIGKHTLLIQKDQGSWHFLGEILTDVPLPADARAPAENLCGGCQACMRACPTGAIVAPYTLDARRCISYLTIEHPGSIPEALRPQIGNRIFGCDDCQLVCPWNRQAELTDEPDFRPRHGLDAARLLELWSWDEHEWLRRTEGMPLRRLNFARWLRNLAIAIGNAPPGDANVAALRERESHPDAMVREHVAWALKRQQAH